MNQSIADKGLLLVILLAIFVVPSSISGTAVALPAIGIDTHAPLTSLQWVVNAFNLTFACFTLAWGTLADAFGRRRCFLMGAVLYTLASLLSAIADDPLLLDFARAVAGIGAAAIFSCGIAILSTHFDGVARMQAFALFGTVAGLGVSLGPTLSGLMLDSFGWRAIFWGHVIALMLVLLGSPFIHRDKPGGRASSRFDTLGATLFILSLLALMMAIVQGSQWGWSSNGVYGLTSAFIVLLVVFVRREMHHSHPILDLSLLANRIFVGMALVTVAASFGFVTLLTYLPSYLGTVLHLTATQAGLSMLLLTMPMLVCPMLAGKLVMRCVSSSSVLNASLLCLLAGVLWLAMASHPGGGGLWQLAAPLLLVGGGMGLSAGLVDGMALKAVAEEKAGMAAGLLNTFRLGSEAIAVALYGSLLTTLLGERLRGSLSIWVNDDDILNRLVNAVAAGNLEVPLHAVVTGKVELVKNLLVSGYDNAFHGVLWVLAAIILILTSLIAWLIRPHKALVAVTQPQQ